MFVVNNFKKSLRKIWENEGCWTAAVVWHNLQFFAQTGNRQQISKDQNGFLCAFCFVFLYILYFVFLASSLAQLALLRRDRQPSVNINGSKIYSCWKKVFAKNKQRQKQNNLKGRFLWHLAVEKNGKQEKVNISTDQKFIPIEKSFCKERWQNQNNLMGRFLWHLAAEKNGKQEIYSQPNKERRTVNNCQLSKIAKTKTITTMIYI